MFANPIIRRYRFSQLRPQQLWVFGSLYVCLALLILFINSSIYRYGEGGYKTLTELYQGLFVQFAVLEIFLLWLLCPANCSSVVAREIADKSFDFFRMLPLSASAKTFGILMGRNLFCLLTATLNMGLCLLFAFAGEISTGLIQQMAAIVIAMTLALNLLAMLFSVITYKKSKVTSLPVLIVIGLFTFGPVMGALVAAVDNQRLEHAKAFFFTFEMPILYLIAACAVFVAGWAYVGAGRRFTREYESLFSRAGAILFLLSLMAVLYGLFYTFFHGQDARDVTRFFWIFSLIPMGVIPPFAMRSFDNYLEISRTAPRMDGLFARLVLRSNGVSGLALYVIWLAFAVAAGMTAKADLLELLWVAMVSLSAYLVLLALLETYVTWQPKNEKIGYLLGFAAVLYIVLPFILAALFDHEYFMLFSPFGVIQIFESEYHLPILLMPIFLNLFWLLPLGLLIGKRYNDLVTIRAGIQVPPAVMQ